MKKRLSFLMIISVCAIFVYFSTCVLMLPDSISLMEGEVPAFSDMAQTVLNVTVEPVTDNITLDDSAVTLKALGVPVKSLNLDIFQETEVVPWGQTVGVRIDTDGVMVLGTGVVTDSKGISHNPAEGILKSGDMILTADSRKLSAKEDLIEAVKTGGEVIQLSVRRDGKVYETTIRPVVGLDGSQKKIGVWVRDSTQGIGTITYYNPATGKFAALGHGIMDIDTKKLMTIKSGEVWPSNITDVKKGRKGAPGELVGRMNTQVVLGRVNANSPQGIYGTIEKSDGIPKERMKIALQSKVHEGPAVIRSNINEYQVREYDIYIESVNHYSADSSRGMVIRITDPELLSKTGGIVQGMSGSPIIQGNMLIGAVTHVFVQDPAKGYGIFIENMLKQEKLL